MQPELDEHKQALLSNTPARPRSHFPLRSLLIVLSLGIAAVALVCVAFTIHHHKHGNSPHLSCALREIDFNSYPINVSISFVQSPEDARKCAAVVTEANFQTGYDSQEHPASEQQIQQITGILFRSFNRCFQQRTARCLAPTAIDTLSGEIVGCGIVDVTDLKVWGITKPTRDALLLFQNATEPSTKLSHVYNFGVSSLARNRGIGTALMQKSEEWAKQVNTTQMCLEVEQENNAAIGLYSKLGFVSVAMQQMALLKPGPSWLTNIDCDVAFMTKML
eukprot:c11440_g1_i1.p1 GENE.c11440_g1_i1~~c11440_g1_i1.p1  ORF type:complete len:277 (-),score=53.05 c11440_g1_i1:86-916(-)